MWGMDGSGLGFKVWGLRFKFRAWGLGRFSVQAYAAARFAESCLRALDGDSEVYECAYVASDVSGGSTLPPIL